jgi:pimeloyl-ACP methyl ester carboxylesterase
MRGRRVFLAALFILSPSRPAASQAVTAGETVSLNGIEMYFETRGEGEPLLMVHGWSGNTAYFQPLLKPLAEHYRLIIPDLRGHGRSTNPSGRFTMAQAASDLLALLRHLGLEDVRALGASAGGITLLHMATAEPSPIRSMILVGTGNRFPEACRSSMAVSNADEYPESWWEIMRARHPGGEGQIRELVAYLRSFSANTADATFPDSVLAGVEAKTLIVHGDQDWCFPPALAAEIHAAIPEASLWVIPGGEHVPVLGEHAPDFIDTALNFFKSDGEGIL